MIERGTTPRVWGWRGLWAVVGLGVLLLPAGARAQPPAKADPDRKPDEGGIRFSLPVQFVATGAATDDLDKAKAELKELEAKLAKKQGEVAEIAARVEALRAIVAKAAAPDGRRVVVWQVVPEGDGIVLKNARQPPAPPPGGAPAVVAQPGFVVRLAPAEADKRIDDLESKLKAILEEVEQLRRERKPGAPQSNRDTEGPRFRIVFGEPSQPQKEPQPKEPAAVPGQFRLILQGLKVQAAEKQAAAAEALAREAQIEANLKAAEADRQAAEAKVRQLEEELQKLKATSGDGPKKP